MYIDKLYTKLYSDKNWNGLNTLISEIKLFARRDYEGLTDEQKYDLRKLRNKIADEMRLRQSRISGYDYMNNKLKDIQDDVTGGAGARDAGVRQDLNDYVADQVRENKANYGRELNEGLRLADMGRKLTSNYRDNKLSKSWNPFRKKLTDGISKSDQKLLGL